jgi:hypothetical protein
VIAEDGPVETTGFEEDEDVIEFDTEPGQTYIIVID